MFEGRWSNVCSRVDSCALTGAAAFFAGIPDAVLVANGPIWCYFYALRHLEPSCPSLIQRFYCSQPDSNAVVYGSEECLNAVLEQVAQRSRPGVVLIENSCAISLIGDDLAGIAGQAELSCPIVCIDSGGLNGGFQAGYEAAAKAYFSQLPLQRKRVVKAHSINLLGCNVAYYNAANDLAELKRLLHLAGYDVIACPGAGSSTQELAEITTAELNVVVHQELGEGLARMLQEEYGMPYKVALPPYGIEGTTAWLEMINTACSGMSQLNYAPWQKEADAAQRFVAAATLEMQRLWGEPWFARVLVAAPPSVALGLAQALRCEWIDAGHLTTLFHGQTPTMKMPDCIDEVIDANEDSRLAETALRQLNDSLLLGSSNEKAVLQREGVSNVLTMNIALPVQDEVLLSDRPFMGLRGARQLYETLWNRYIETCKHGKA